MSQWQRNEAQRRNWTFYEAFKIDINKIGQESNIPYEYEYHGDGVAECGEYLNLLMGRISTIVIGVSSPIIECLSR